MHHNIALSRVFNKGELGMNSSRIAIAMRTMFVASMWLLMWTVAASAQVKVLISGGFSSAYERLLPEFEQTSGIKVTTGSGSSQGSGPQTIGAFAALHKSACFRGLNRLSALADSMRAHGARR